MANSELEKEARECVLAFRQADLSSMSDEDFEVLVERTEICIGAFSNDHCHDDGLLYALRYTLDSKVDQRKHLKNPPKRL